MVSLVPRSLEGRLLGLVLLGELPLVHEVQALLLEGSLGLELLLVQLVLVVGEGLLEVLQSADDVVRVVLVLVGLAGLARQGGEHGHVLLAEGLGAS